MEEGTSTCNSSTETLSTCVSRSTTAVNTPQKIHNLDYVLDLLDTTFNQDRTASNKDLPHENIGNIVKRSLKVDTFLDFIRLSNHPAIIAPTLSTTKSRMYMTHEQIYTFIEQSCNLANFNLRHDDRVAVCLPDGPCLNLCLLSIIAYCVCVPSNYYLTPDELLADYRNLKVKAVIVPFEKLLNYEADPLVNTMREGGLQLIGLEKSSDFNFTYILHEDTLVNTTSISNNKIGSIMRNNPLQLNQADDVVLLLSTSGTCGRKKIVPYSLRTLCISTTCVVFSLHVRHSDTNVNMMPLYHVGGIIRNLLTPIFVGGSVIQCQGFDPVLFCDILETYENSIWFYGVPSMQQAILHESLLRKLPKEHCGRLKKICNAGGGLSPSLAKQLKEVFTEAVILPSYGMTECMPICAPPVDYSLEREGSSGQLAGPELAISINGNQINGDSIVGHILIRGAPCFEGYEDIDSSITFDRDGWFDTGDIGYLKDGYIYITSRSKEIINRGGEVISPMEIEEALITHPKVAEVMVFSVTHEVLQETVGCVIVTRDSQTRPDLRSLRAFLENKLHHSKHPQLIVYMDNIPRNIVGKPLRINLNNRLNLPTIYDTKDMAKLLYEAQCPPKGTPLNESIRSSVIQWSANDVIAIVKKLPQVKDCTAYQNQETHKFILFVLSSSTNDLQNYGLVQDIHTYLHSEIHDYMLPTDIAIIQDLRYNADGSIDTRHIEYLAKQHHKTTDDPLTLALCDIFATVIDMAKDSHGNVSQFPPDGDFFDYGGDSLKSGFLISQIRSKLGVSLPVSILYQEKCRTPIGLAEICRQKIPENHPSLTHGYGEINANYQKSKIERPSSGSKNPFNFFVMLFQGSPIYLLRPLQFTIRWILFVYSLILFSSMKCIQSTHAEFQIIKIVLAIGSTAVATGILFPLIGILVKWLVIGRYRAGSYPLWGQYYLRWWFVNKVLILTDVGIFQLHPMLFAAYLKLMGATVGRNSSISRNAVVGEYDLITIGTDCYLDDYCIIRPFVLTRGHMKLSKIVIGDNCVAGLRTNVVAGSIIPSGTSLGPQTTTYTREMLNLGSAAPVHTAQGKELRNLSQQILPVPHFMLQFSIGWMIISIVYLISHLPWLYCLYLVVGQMSYFRSDVGNKFANLIIYFATPRRIGYLFISRCVRNNVVPVLHVFVVILVKLLVIGKFKPGPRKLNQMSLMRYWLMQTLFTKKIWRTASTILGAHYEMISVMYRLLGAKVGKRVYWPGGLIKVIEFDLLTIGNDVILGSRSQIICGDAIEYAPVTIEDGGMLADNCVMLPGSRIGRNAILGSGGLLKKHFTIPDGSVWYGSFNGNAVKFRDSDYMVKKGSENGNKESQESDTVRPFGRAFYQRKANYFVIPLVLIIIYNFILMGATDAVIAVPPVIATTAAAEYIHLNHSDMTDKNYILYLIIFSGIAFFQVVITIFNLTLEIALKWALFGRRRKGTYNWDKSSYNQRWQILVSIQTMVRRDTLTLLGGSSWIVLFFRALGCKIGKRVCIYPSGGDPMMTEPDLVTLENDAAVDNAALICHMNTLGQFTLNPIHIGEGSVLQNNSRLAAGSTMLRDCTLLDRSYIIPGEVAEANTVWQGYPAGITSIEKEYSIYENKLNKSVKIL